jgi:hypothetical protein
MLSVVPLNVVTPSVVSTPWQRNNTYLPYLLSNHPSSQGKYNIGSVTCVFAIDSAASCASVNAALEVQYLTAVAGSSSKAFFFYLIGGFNSQCFVIAEIDFVKLF